MKSRRSACVTASVVAALHLSAQRIDGQAGSISVFPTKLTLAPNISSGSIRLKNDSASEARFQISAHTWSSSPSGEMQLAPTQDLIVFPALLALKAGESRGIRVGTTVKAGTTELPYRLVIEELGDASDTPPASGIQMLRRLNLPVFIQPANRQLRVELDRVIVARPGVVAAHVRNLGSVHFVVGDMRLEGRDAAGASVVANGRNGWYVLPGDDITYEIPFDAAACAYLASIRVSIVLRDVPVDRLTETTELAPGGCAGR
jgi:fimbrial chaperone protein